VGMEEVPSLGRDGGGGTSSRRGRRRRYLIETETEIPHRGGDGDGDTSSRRGRGGTPCYGLQGPGHFLCSCWTDGERREGPGLARGQAQIRFGLGPLPNEQRESEKHTHIGDFVQNTDSWGLKSSSRV